MQPRWSLPSVDPQLRQRYLAAGLWNDESLGELLWRGLVAGADKDFTVHSQRRPWSGRFAEVLDGARRLAGGLRTRGIGPGDAVAFQLPNWVEAATVFYATAMLGATVVPIVHIYGSREVGHIVRQSRARVLVVADRFRHIDYLAMLEDLRPQLGDLELVAVVGDAQPHGTVTLGSLSGSPIDAPAHVDPDSPALVAYTSGTTAEAKGVIHTHRTVGAEVRQMAAMQGDGPPTLVGAPVGHAIGMLGALLMPVHNGIPINLIDIWDPGAALDIMLARGLGAGGGATYFFASLLDHERFDERHRRLMSHIGLGGAPVPAAFADRADAMGMSLVRFYGSTEHPSTTGTTHDEPRDKRLHTDGRPLNGVEIRIVDDDGHDIERGRSGEILSRGPDLFAGYTDAALTAAAVDSDGWYATGDVGILDADGYLTITERKKDVIIRGGENISAAEVEELLLNVDGVAEVAVVAAPDVRLGEHACAFVRLYPGVPAPSVESLRARLEAAGLARQKCPEELRIVEDLPRTPSGKVQKALLRDALRREPGPIQS